MRSLLPLLFAGLAVSACQCGPDGGPTPVVFRVENPLQGAIFVDQSEGTMGLKIKRRQGFEWVDAAERLSCECVSCEAICGGACACAPVDPRALVMKVAPGDAAERSWDGVLQVEGHASCPGTLVQGPECQRAQNPPVDEELRLELCYALTAPGAEDADAGEVVPGNLAQASTICVEKPFRVRDGVVQIAPSRGTACAQHADCAGEGELCFDGACTTACPAPGFPRLAATWQVRISEPNDQGFFTVTQDAQRRTLTGTGTVGSVRYDNGTLTLSMRRELADGGVGGPSAQIYVTLPEGVSVPIALDEVLTVTVVDRSTDDNPENRGVVIRDAQGTLLLAADTAQKGMVLAAADVAPFSVSRGSEIVGCEHTDCGKNLFEKVRFAAGETSVALSPGTSQELAASGQVWRVANVASERYASTWCNLDDLMPWVVANQRVEGL